MKGNQPTYIANPVLDKLPDHLRQFIKPQNYDQYSAIDQAVWRYVMRKNVHFLKDAAHESYLYGLREAGISTDRIPSMYGMNRILKKIGWAAVAVDGFIPPAAFMDFQAYNVLVIASDIRKLKHIEYTPAPDIIHESAGHAPIIVNPEYSEFLRHFGEIGSKALSTKKDYELYNAIRHLSIIKEAEGIKEQEIKDTEEKIAFLSANMGPPSEMDLLRTLHWWTVEYGLIGTLEEPKIYGAGLLSSIGESTWCMSDKVRKIPLTIEAAYQDYDITRPQPQLFVTPDFAHLSLVLEEFTDTLAMRCGGLDGMRKLVNSGALGTAELSSGLQVSGIFSDVKSNDEVPVYFRTKGKSALAYREKELIGHSKDHYPDGFSSPVGKLKGINIPIEKMNPRDLKALNIYEGEDTILTFESGVTVKGKVVTGKRNLQGDIMLIKFANCLVKYRDEVLYTPDRGTYNMAVGESIVSAFNGSADLESFTLDSHVPAEETIHSGKTEQQIELEALYDRVRQFREGNIDSLNPERILETLQKHHRGDWLLSVELYELTSVSDDFKKEVYHYLREIKETLPEYRHLIDSGIELARIESLQKTNTKKNAEIKSKTSSHKSQKRYVK